MRVVMTRTVRVGNRVDPFVMGEAYDLPDALAASWISYGVADSHEGSDAPAESGDDRTPPKRRGRRDAADHARVTEAEG